MFISSHCVTLRVEACFFELEGDHEIVQIKRSSNYRAGAGMNGRRATLRRHNTKKLPLDSLLGIRCYYAFLAGNFVNNAAVYPRKHASLHAKLEARPTLYLRPLHPRKPQRAPWRHSISRPCRDGDPSQLFFRAPQQPRKALCCFFPSVVRTCGLCRSCHKLFSTPAAVERYGKT